MSDERARRVTWHSVRHPYCLGCRDTAEDVAGEMRSVSASIDDSRDWVNLGNSFEFCPRY